MLKGNMLKRIREEKGMSQFDLALMAKINPSEISRLENGKIYPYSGWKRKLSIALEIPENEIFPE